MEVDLSPHEQGEHHRGRHDAQAAELNQQEEDELRRKGEETPRVDDDKSRDADGRRRREKGVDEAQRTDRGIKKPYKEGSCADQRQEPPYNGAFNGKGAVGPEPYRSSASRAFSAMPEKTAASLTARSANIFLLTAMSAFLRPLTSML